MGGVAVLVLVVLTIAGFAVAPGLRVVASVVESGDGPSLVVGIALHILSMSILWLRVIERRLDDLPWYEDEN